MALSRRAMRTGALRQIVTIESKGSTNDGSGGNSAGWSTFAANVPAAIEPLSGAERFQSEQTQYRITHRVTIRLDPSKVPTTAMRISFGGRFFYVVAVVNPDELNVWLELACEERAV